MECSWVNAKKVFFLINHMLKISHAHRFISVQSFMKEFHIFIALEHIYYWKIFIRRKRKRGNNTRLPLLSFSYIFPCCWRPCWMDTLKIHWASGMCFPSGVWIVLISREQVTELVGFRLEITPSPNIPEMFLHGFFFSWTSFNDCIVLGKKVIKKCLA